jgi:hypothetical protein
MPSLGDGGGATGTGAGRDLRPPPACQLFWKPTPAPGMPPETVRRPVVLAETPAPLGPTRRLPPRWLAVSRTPGPSFTLFRMRKPIPRA